MIGAAKRKSISPPGLSALWSILLLVVALCLPETRVWGFAVTPQPASGVFESASPSSIGEFTTVIGYDVSGSPVAAKVDGAAVTVAREGSGAFEIIDGVRRAKAVSLAGRSSIPAEVMVQGKIVQRLELSVDALRSPKASIDISNAAKMQRWQITLGQTQVGSVPPPILVQPGSSGTRIGNVFLDAAGDGF
jgi:hypothetical protein